MKALHTVAFILVVVGALNWLLVGLGIGYSGMGIVEYLPATLAKIVYVLVGISAIYIIVTHKQTCKNCSGGSSSQM